MTIMVHGSTVTRDGRPVATLAYSGRAVTVRDPSGEQVLGRLFRSDVPAQRPYTYNAWTALSPAAVTPSDTILAIDLVIEDAVALILDRHEETE